MCITQTPIIYAVIGGLSGLAWGDDGIFYACCGCFLYGFLGG